MSQSNYTIIVTAKLCHRLNRDCGNHLHCCRCHKAVNIGEQAFSHAPQAGHGPSHYCIPCAEEVRLL